MLGKGIWNEYLTVIWNFQRKASLEILPLSVLIIFNPSTHLPELIQRSTIFQNPREIVNITCRLTAVGILSLEREIRGWGSSEQLNVATHRTRKRKIKLGGNLRSILCFFFAQIFPCIVICSFEEKYGSQTAITRMFFHGIPRPRSSFIFNFAQIG